MSPYPGYTGNFQQFRLEDDLVPDDASFADADARMRWFKVKLLPAWQQWRLTNTRIDIFKLLRGDYK